MLAKPDQVNNEYQRWSREERRTAAQAKRAFVALAGRLKLDANDWLLATGDLIFRGLTPAGAANASQPPASTRAARRSGLAQPAGKQ